MVIEAVVRKGYKKTEVGIIPNDWDVKKLGDIGDAIIGLTYSPSEVVDYGKLVHRSSNIQNNRLSYDDNVYVDKTINEKLILKDNDILICVRNGSRDLIGKSALITGKSVGETFGAFMSVFRTNKCQKFIFYLILSNLIQRQINESLGATINQITNKTLNSFKIPYPSKLEEPDAISEVLSDTDSLITSLETLIEKKRNIKKGTMQELLTGKRRLPGFSDKWEQKLLGEVVFFTNGKAHENFISDEGDFIVINSKFVSTAGEIKKYSKICLSPVGQGEIVMVMSDVPNGKAIAKCFYIDKNNTYTLNQRICSLRARDLDSKFLYYLIDRNPYYLTFDDGVKQTNLRKEDVLNCPIKIPKSRDEQIAIVEVLDNIVSEIESLENELLKYRLIKQGMMQELLTGKIRLV